MSPARASSIALPIEPSPARPRLAATRPTDILVEGEVFPGTDPNSPLAELTQRIMSNDRVFSILNLTLQLMRGNRGEARQVQTNFGGSHCSCQGFDSVVAYW